MEQNQQDIEEATPLLSQQNSATKKVSSSPKSLIATWKYCIVAVSLSAIGLLVTTSSMGMTFSFISFDSENSIRSGRPLKGTAPSGGPGAPPLLPLPSGKSADPPAPLIKASTAQEKTNEDNVETGSPNDPTLGTQREKKEAAIAATKGPSKLNKDKATFDVPSNALAHPATGIVAEADVVEEPVTENEAEQEHVEVDLEIPSSFELVETTVTPGNYPYIMHYKYADNDCTSMVGAEGHALDICFQTTIGEAATIVYQKNVAFTTPTDTGIFSYYYSDSECSTLATDALLESDFSPTSTTVYKTECYVSESGPGRTAIVNVPDVKSIHYDTLGLSAYSSVLVASYANDECSVPHTFIWQRTDVCYNDAIYRCNNGFTAHKLKYEGGSRCIDGENVVKDASMEVGICAASTQAAYSAEGAVAFMHAECWDLAAPVLSGAARRLNFPSLTGAVATAVGVVGALGVLYVHDVL